MSTTGEYSGSAPIEQPPQDFVPLIFERFEERSVGAYAPGEIEDYRRWRHSEWPAASGYSIEEQAERNAYHAERRANRGHEAVTPGEDTRIPMLDVRQGKRTGTRTEPIGTFRQKVFSYDDGAYHYTEPTTWTPGQFSIIPKFTVRTTSLSSSEHAVLAALWSMRDKWEWQVNVRAVVKGRNQEEIGNHSGLSHNRVSEVTDALEVKGFLTKKADGFGEPCRYFLACADHGHWTYAALDSDSARRRIQRLLSKDVYDIDWSLAGKMSMWNQKRQKEGERKDEAQRKLERDQRRGAARRQEIERSGQQSTGEALAALLDQYRDASGNFRRVSGDELHNRWKRNRNGQPPPPDDKPPN